MLYCLIKSKWYDWMIKFNYLDCSTQHASNEIGCRCDFESNCVNDTRKWIYWACHIIFVNYDAWSSLQIDSGKKNVNRFLEWSKETSHFRTTIIVSVVVRLGAGLAVAGCFGGTCIVTVCIGGRWVWAIVGVTRTVDVYSKIIISIFRIQIWWKLNWKLKKKKNKKENKPQSKGPLPYYLNRHRNRSDWRFQVSLEKLTKMLFLDRSVHLPGFLPVFVCRYWKWPSRGVQGKIWNWRVSELKCAGWVSVCVWIFEKWNTWQMCNDSFRNENRLTMTPNIPDLLLVLWKLAWFVDIHLMAVVHLKVLNLYGKFDKMGQMCEVWDKRLALSIPLPFSFGMTLNCNPRKYSSKRRWYSPVGSHFALRLL